MKRLLAAFALSLTLSASAQETVEDAVRAVLHDANARPLVLLQPHPESPPGNVTAPGTMPIPVEDQTPVEEDDPGSAVPS